MRKGSFYRSLRERLIRWCHPGTTPSIPEPALFFGFVIALFFCATTHAAEPDFFFNHLEHEWNVPFDGASGELTRLSMVEEMGHRYPELDCSDGCARATTALERKACHLGLLGGIYLLTGIQHETHRSPMTIWQVPNSSLTVEPYAYFKEMDAGIPCAESRFIRRFPTREPRPGEGPAPVERVRVCHAWRAFFAAAEKGFHPHGLPPVLEKARLYKEALAVQSKLWTAHTYSLLHMYWQQADALSWEAQSYQVPEREYRMWMGWNRIVGDYVPTVNLFSCSDNVTSLAKQLMPHCLYGTTGANGAPCTADPVGHVLGETEAALIRAFQNTLATEDFSHAIESMRGHVRQDHRNADLK